MSSARKHAYGSATARQRAFIERLCREVAPEAGPFETAKRFGGPDNMRGLTKSEASRLIRNLIDASPRSSPNYYEDPGELAADRWAESQVGL